LKTRHISAQCVKMYFITLTALIVHFSQHPELDRGFVMETA